ncbi:hypothetical protein D3C71_1506060 [compost metagenome]
MGGFLRLRLAMHFGQARDELVDEHAHVGADFLVARHQAVVAKQRGDRDEQTHRGRQQGGGHAGRDGVDVDVTRHGGAQEHDHDAQHRAQQADVGAAGNGV